MSEQGLAHAQSATVSVKTAPTRSHGQSRRKSEHGGQRRCGNPDLVFDQRDLVRGLRQLIRHQGHERIAIDGRAQSQRQLDPYLHQQRGHRHPIRGRHRERPGAYRDPVGEPDHRRDRRCLDPDLIVDECDLLLGVGRLERLRGN